MRPKFKDRTERNVNFSANPSIRPRVGTTRTEAPHRLPHAEPTSDPHGLNGLNAKTATRPAGVTS